MRRSDAKRSAVVAAMFLAVAVLLAWLWIVATSVDETPASPLPEAPPVVHAPPVEPRPAPVVEETPPDPTPAPAPPPPRVVVKPATLVVRVVDAGRRAAVVRAEISLVDAAGDEWGGATDASGDVRFERLPPGATEIHAAAVDSLPADRTVVLAAGAKETVEFALESAAALDGVVVDAANGAPIAKADVDVFAHDDADNRALGHASADATGRFRFDVLPPATDVVVKAWLVGYARTATTATLRAAGKGAEHVELRLRRGVALRGVVRLPDGRGVGGATVHVASTDGAWDGAYSESTADGSYAVRGIPLGTPVTATAHLKRWADSATEFVAPRADGADAVRDLALRRPATLVVRVTSPSGYAPGVKVWVDDDRDSGKRSQTTDPPWTLKAERTKPPHESTMSIHEGLAPGPHVVHVEPTQYAATGREIAIAEGERMEIDIALGSGVAIEGVLVDDAGTAVAGAAVFALPSDFEHRRRRVSDAVRHATSKPDGSFRIDGLGPGRHDLYVLGARENDLASPAIDPTRTDVDAPSKDVRIIVPRETRIVLRVATPNGAPRPTEVVVTQDDGEGLNVNGDVFRRTPLVLDADAWAADGVVKCSFPPGASWLRVSVPGFAPELVRVPQWEFGRVVDLGEITLDAGRSLHGVVLDSAGKPLAGASITTSADPPGRPPIFAKDDGKFVVEHLAQGPVLVYAKTDGRIGSRYVFETFAVPSIVIVARRTGTLKGVVVDAAGAPVKGARVVFQHGGVYLHGSTTEFMNVVAVPDDAVTGDDGTFAVPVPFGACIGIVGGARFEVLVPEGGEASVRVVTK